MGARRRTIQPFDRGPSLGRPAASVHLHPGQPHHGLRPGDRRVQSSSGRTPTTRTDWPSTPTAVSTAAAPAGAPSYASRPDGGTATIVDRLDGQRLNTPNDLAIDRRGRIWFSNPWNEGNIDPSEQQENMNRDILRADPQPRRQPTPASG